MINDININVYFERIVAISEKANMFLSIVNKSSLSVLDTRDWASGSADHFVAVAEHDFMADGEDEITFRKGQKLNVAPKGNTFSGPYPGEKPSGLP